MADPLTAEHFAPHLGKTFRPAGRSPDLTFVRLDRHEVLTWEDATRQPFTLILRGPRDDVLPEGHYHFAVDDGPSFELYVIPIFTPARSHQDYQVAFN